MYQPPPRAAASTSARKASRTRRTRRISGAAGACRVEIPTHWCNVNHASREVIGTASAFPKTPMIQANCRERFTADDFDFVVRTLSRSEKDGVNLVDLLTDADARDAILDDPRLVNSVLADGEPLTISPQLYFYVLIRHVLKATGLNDRNVSD